MPVIESLQIELNTTAKNANKDIDGLIDRLGTLAFSLGRINGSNLTGLANGVQRLGNAMQTMKNVNTADFSRLANNITKIGQIDTASINSASSAITMIAKSFGKLEGVSESSKQLVELANAIKQLGYKSSTKAIENIPKLAESMRKLMTELSKAPKVSQNLIDMTNALSKLARTGSSSGKAANSLSTSLNKYDSSARKSSKGTRSLASAIGKLYASYWVFLRGYRKLKEAIDISSQLTEVQNVVNVTFGDYKKLVEEMSKTSITDFGMSELTVKQVSSRFQAMGTAMGFTQEKMADMSVELTKLTADMASFYDVSQKDVAKDLESIFTGMTRPLRQYGLDLTEATLKEWAMRNGIEVNMKSLSQMEKTMLRYQYVLANTKNAQDDFLRTQDTWANQTRILKQNFQQLGIVIGGSFINALKPMVKALNAAIGHVINFANVVSNALGKIFGWKFEDNTGGIVQDFEDAEESADGIADATGDAANNIKKMQAGLRAFDELKTINMTDSSTSGGSSSGLGAGVGTVGQYGGQWVQTDGLLKAYESSIDTLYKLGDKISETLVKTMQNIKWEKIYEGARNFGTGLASFLNGIFADQNGITLFGAVGKTIAGALNTAIQAALSFGEEFDFEQFGKNIADGINNFFRTFNFKKFAETINTWAKGIWNTIKTAFSNIDWKSVWNGVKDFLENIDLEAVAIVIGLVTIKKIIGLHLAKSALDIIGTVISRQIAQAIASKLGVEIAANAGIKEALSAGIMAKMSTLGTNIGLSIEGVFSGLSVSEAFGAVFGTVATTIAGIASVIGGLILSVTSFFEMWENGWGIVGEILKDIGIALAAVGAVLLGVAAAPAAIVAAVVAAVSTIAIVVHDNWETIKEWFSNAGEWFNKNVITPISDFFKGLWEDVSGFFTNLWNDIVGIWENVSGWFDEHIIQPIVGFFVGFATRVGQIFEGLWILVQAIWIKVSSWFDEHIIQPVVNLFQKLWEKVSSFFLQLWSDIVSIWTSVSSWFSEYVTEPVKRVFDIAKEKIFGIFSSLWNKIKDIWKSVFSWFDKTVINPVSNAFKKACDTIGGFFSNLWSGIKKGVVNAMNSVIGAIEGGINFIVNGVNGILKGFNKLVSWGADIVGKKWDGVTLIPKVSLSRIDIGGYEAGGFPEPYSLFAMNEGGKPEWLGDIGGKTGVVGNGEISGIREAVYETSREEMNLLRQQNRLLQLILEKEIGITKDDIGKAARDWAQDYSRRTGEEAYSF